MAGKVPPRPAPKSAPAGKPGISKGAIIVAVAGVILVMAVAWFRDNIKAYMTIKPWDKAAPCAYIDRFSQALKTGDAQMAKALLGGESASVEVDSGRIVKFKSTIMPSQQPATDAKVAVLAGSVSPSDATFVVDPVTPYVVVRARNEGGKTAEFTLYKSKTGQWSLRQVFEK